MIMMQKCKQRIAKPILWTIFLFACNANSGFSQSQTPDKEQYRSQLDSTFLKAKNLCENDSTKSLVSNWISYANSITSILDEVDLVEKYRHIDFRIELSKALNKAINLDKKGEFLHATQNAIAINILEMSNLGLEAMDNARKHKSIADAERAIEFLTICLEDYKETGPSQKMVDSYWKEEELDWKWIRFYKAVCLRMSNKTSEAEKEYQTLYKIGWTAPIVFLELADLQIKNGKVEDATKTLMMGHEKNNTDPRIACVLAKIYLQTDQLKKAQAIMKLFMNHRSENVEVALVTALVYEKKGDIKKADVFFKALYKSDAHEVDINRTYAGFLLRRAVISEKTEAEEYAQQAYNLLAHAVDLSPNNDYIKKEWEEIKVKYPKVYKTENIQ